MMATYDPSAGWRHDNATRGGSIVPVAAKLRPRCGQDAPCRCARAKSRDLAYCARVKSIQSAPARFALVFALALAIFGCAGNPPEATAAAVVDAPTSRDLTQPDLATETKDRSKDAAEADRPAGNTAVASDAGSAVASEQPAPAADALADASALDAGNAGTTAEAGCSGWTTLKHLSPAEVADLIATSAPIVINVHTPYEGDLPGTDTSIPFDHVPDLETYLHNNKCADVVLICKGGGMSQSAGDELIKLGYLRIRDLDGGMRAWQAAGYPLLKDGGT